MVVFVNVIKPQGLEPLQFPTKFRSPSRDVGHQVSAVNLDLTVPIHCRRAGPFAAALWLLSVTTLAAQADGPDLPPLQVGTVEIVGHEVFDEPTQGISAPYRLANRFHVLTRENVIRRELLLGSGDPLDPELLAQTERNLRALPFLRDARVEINPLDTNGDGLPDRADLRIVTWDSWSLTPRVEFERVGDRSVWEVGVSERNLLGWGKEVAASHEVTLDRTANRFWYTDRQLAGSRIALTAAIADLSDGDEQIFTLTRPFYSLQDEWAFSVRAIGFNRRDPLFLDGNEVAQLPHRATWGDVELGWAVLRRSASALRLHAAYRLRKESVAGQRRDFGIAEVGIRSVEHRFVQLTHVNRFERTEDVNLGPQSYGTLGISTSALGGQESRVLFVATGHRRAIAFAPTHFLVGGVGVAARHDHGQWINVLGETRFRYLRKHATRHALVGKLDFRVGRNLNPEVQLVLGTASGLRGYPVRRFAGTRSLLLSAEERWFVAADVGQLLSVGVAAFVDSGFVWPEEESIDLADLKTAVGVSLLLGSNRLSAGPGIRFDVAYALDPVTNTGRWVFNSLSTIEL